MKRAFKVKKEEIANQPTIDSTIKIKVDAAPIKATLSMDVNEILDSIRKSVENGEAPEKTDEQPENVAEPVVDAEVAKEK